MVLMDINTKLEELEARNHGDYWIVRCPVCGRKEAYIYRDDVIKHQKNSKFKIPIRCNRLNKCGKTSYIEDVDIKNIPKVLDEDIIGISQNGINKLNALVHLSHCLNGFDFDWRGISNKTMKANGVIYLRNGLLNFMKTHGKNEYHKRFYSKSYEDRTLIFPIKNYQGDCERLLLRSTLSHDDKYKKEIGMRLVKHSSEVWNRKDLISPNISTVFVTEGVPDGLSIKEVNQNNGVVSLPGVKKYKQLIKEIKAHEESRSKKYIVSFDNDDAGIKYIEKLSLEFNKLGINYDFFDLNGYKDLNEFLQKDRDLFFKTVNKYTKKHYKINRKKEENKD